MTGAGDVPRVSPRGQRLFAAYARRYVRRHFHAVRVRRLGALPEQEGTPTIFYLNHPSWWDPLVALVIARHLLPSRLHLAPVATNALAAYRFLGRLGLFGVGSGPRGAREFLRTTMAICARPEMVLWLTPQGRFSDPRERPLRLEGGLGHLVARLPRAVVVPVALEYAFWEERTPEALALVARPEICEGGSRTARGWTSFLESRLEEAMDALAESARRRRAEPFETVLAGRAGVGGLYDLWRRLRAAVRREKFSQEHGRL